jgi:hypothetical protein
MNRGSHRRTVRRRSRSSRQRRSSSGLLAAWFSGKRWHVIAATAIVIGSSFLLAKPERGRSAVAAAGRLLRDPLGVFDSRSPGERQAGALTQTKARLASATGPHGPHERVLSQIRERPVTGTDPALLGPLGLPVLPTDGPGYAVGQGGGSPAGGLSPIALPSFASAGAGGEPGPQLPGPNVPYSPPPNAQQQSVSPAASAVPEPATWAMMVVGFLAIGMTLRRAKGGSLTRVDGDR